MDQELTGHPVPRELTKRPALVLGATAVLGECLLGLVGGLPGLGLGATLIAVGALSTARYVAGAGSENSNFRRNVRLMTGRPPAMGEWYWTVRNGLDQDGYRQALRPGLQRLYAARLSERHNVSLHHDRDRAAALIGPAAWPWLDPEQPPPSDTLPRAVLAQLVRRLETL
ncbi:hypothetical protein C7C46_27795 [Streptomyces tateyamensis]|uniref:Uncharacterized protein n=1 Tax=Streptomyces tateyamensis TaxID=565073 RepID=A0A2V4NV27_9ACTN|nr:hypothetical protein [Streptomyces tateyamensis]PYC69772.1 hypothetical protein C7C46_27795 [Streptomyces tateyamensis]